MAKASATPELAFTSYQGWVSTPGQHQSLPKWGCTMVEWFRAGDDNVRGGPPQHFFPEFCFKQGAGPLMTLLLLLFSPPQSWHLLLFVASAGKELNAAIESPKT
jgi:hypothetical protein